MTIDARFEEQGDERGAVRRTLRLGVSARFGADRTLAATIRNLSTTGLLIETEVELAEGERISVTLPEAGEAAAQVVWCDAPFYGCRFAEELPASALSAAQLRSEPETPGQRGEPAGLGQRIHRLRTERGLSLADIAERLGVSKPTVWAWEHGKSRPVDKRHAALADVLGVSPTELEPASGPSPEAVERSRVQIAEAYGVSPSRVRIMIEV